MLTWQEPPHIFKYSVRPKNPTATEKFRQGDLSPVVEIARLKRVPGSQMPSDNWSLCNRVMAYVQTGSLDCRGYRQWQQAGRQVKQGSQAAYILAPLLVTVEDDKTGKESKELRGFKSIPVFAYHNTEGDPLPEVDGSQVAGMSDQELAAYCANDVKITQELARRTRGYYW